MGWRRCHPRATNLVEVGEGGVKSPQPKRRRPVCQYRIRGRGIVENFFGTGFWPHVFPLYINCLPTVPAKSPRRSVEGHTRPALRQSAALFRSTAPMPGKVRDRGSRADRCAPLAGTVRGPLPELDPGRAPRGRVARPCACVAIAKSSSRGDGARHRAWPAPGPGPRCAGRPTGPGRPVSRHAGALTTSSVAPMPGRCGDRRGRVERVAGLADAVRWPVPRVRQPARGSWPHGPPRCAVALSRQP